MNKNISFTINAIAIAFVAVFIEQVGHESSHGILAVLVGSKWTALNLFFAENAWTGESSQQGEGILTGGAAIVNILLVLVSIAIFKQQKLIARPNVRLFWFYMTALNLFAGFGYLFTDPLFYQRGGENLGDWKKIVDMLGGGWNVRLPIALIGAAGILWGFIWVGRSAHAFLPADKPARLQTSIKLLLIPYIVISLIFTLLAFAGPVKEIAPIIAIKYWFGFFGIGWGAFMAGMWIPAPAGLERSAVPESIQWNWVAASIILFLIAAFILLPTLKISQQLRYYAEGNNFMSRKGIDRGDISLHAYGLPHGPQPGMTEASIGKKETQELAVMMDTFQPLHLTKDALEFEKPEYQDTWTEGSGE